VLRGCEAIGTSLFCFAFFLHGTRKFGLSVIYLYLSTIYFLKDRVTASLFFASELTGNVSQSQVARKRELSQGKGNCHKSKAKSLFVGDLEIFHKKSSHRENSQTNYLYINKSLQKMCCSFFKALSIMKVFSLTIHDPTQPNRKTTIKTDNLRQKCWEGFLFLSTPSPFFKVEVYQGTYITPYCLS